MWGRDAGAGRVEKNERDRPEVLHPLHITHNVVLSVSVVVNACVLAFRVSAARVP